MKANDLVKLSFYNFLNNKRRWTLTAFTIMVLSIIMMVILFIGISASNNIKKAKNVYVKNEEISIKIDNVDTLHGIIKLYNNKSIKKATYYYSKSKDVFLIDFGASNKNYFGISDFSLNKDSNDILLCFELMDYYSVGDTYSLNGYDYVIKGFLNEDSDYSYVIDFSYNYDKYDIDSFSIGYIYSNGDNINDCMKAMSNLSKLAIKNYGTRNVSMDKIIAYNTLSNYSNIIISICALIAIISLLSTIGILYNSISIYIDQNKRALTIFKTYGISKKDMFMYNYFGVLFCNLISTIIGTIIIALATPLFKRLGNNFMLIFDDGNYSSIKSHFVYDSSFIWYIPFISFIAYAVALYVIVINKTKRFYSKELNELYIETLE